MKARKFYLLFTLLCLGGIGWLILQLSSDHHVTHSIGMVCLVKNVTGIPCPSCGSTRSVLAIIEGDFVGALHLNPLGYLLTGLLLIVPLWLIIDLVFQRQSLFTAYKYTERLLIQKYVALPLILLVIANWIWNISKKL